MRKKITKNSKILLCGSLSQYKEILAVRNQLKELGFKKVIVPEGIQEIVKGKPKKSFSRQTGAKGIRLHHKRIKLSEAILLINVPQKGINGYIGANTFLEAGQAFLNNKPLFFLYDLPKWSFYKDELAVFDPTVLKGNLRKLLK